MISQYSKALKLTCPLCKQPPNRHCIGMVGWRKGKPLSTLHNERYPATNREINTKKLVELVLELAEAVDNAAMDIGGSRSQLTILREAVQIAANFKD